jgi:transglutaminase-like putative cysteine protease
MPALTRYRLTHETQYRYSSTVTRSSQLAHLRPRDTDWQQVHAHILAVDPAPAEQSDAIDYFGNPVRRFAVHEPHSELCVRAFSEVTVCSVTERLRAGCGSWEAARDLVRAPDGLIALEIEQYRLGSERAPIRAECAEYARKSFAPGRDGLEAALDLTRRIHRDFVYDPKATTVTTRVEEVLRLRRGVCQDFAHLMISCLRSIGLPARYVSGYVMTYAAPGRPRMVGADASHAWVACHFPGTGWVALDPTNAKLADHEFVTLGWGRDFDDVTPLRGVVLGAADQQLSVAVSVEPVASP